MSVFPLLSVFGNFLTKSKDKIKELSGGEMEYGSTRVQYSSDSSKITQELSKTQAFFQNSRTFFPKTQGICRKLNISETQRSSVAGKTAKK